MKKLLILGGSYVHCKVVSVAKELGIYTIVADYLSDSPAKQIADESWLISIRDIDRIVEECKEHRIDGVLNFCLDPAQIPYNQICERLGLPCFGTAEQFRILTNKPAFKDFLTSCGLDVIPSYSVEQLSGGAVDYPIVIKPSDSRGSRGQSVCHSAEEARLALTQAQAEASDRGVVIEKYMKGKSDFSMTYFVLDGEPNLIRTNDRYLGNEEDHLNKQCVAAISPSRFSEFYLKKIDSKVRAFIKTLGIQFGPIFMQGFVDDDTIRFYDPGFRFPGGEYELFLKKSTGIDLMKALVCFSVNEAVERPPLTESTFRLNGKSVIQLNYFCRSGKISRFIGLDEIRANPMTASLFTRYELGESVPDSGDVRQRVCEVGLLIEKGKSIQDSIAWVNARLDVIDEHGDSMLVSQFDIGKLDDSGRIDSPVGIHLQHGS